MCLEPGEVHAAETEREARAPGSARILRAKCWTPWARWKRALSGTEPPRSLLLCGEILFGCGWAALCGIRGQLDPPRIPLINTNGVRRRQGAKFKPYRAQILCV